MYWFNKCQTNTTTASDVDYKAMLLRCWILGWNRGMSQGTQACRITRITPEHPMKTGIQVNQGISAHTNNRRLRLMKTHLCLLQEAPGLTLTQPLSPLGPNWQNSGQVAPEWHQCFSMCACKVLDVENTPALLCSALLCRCLCFLYRKCDVTESRFRLDGGKIG